MGAVVWGFWRLLTADKGVVGGGVREEHLKAQRERTRERKREEEREREKGGELRVTDSYFWAKETKKEKRCVREEPESQHYPTEPDNQGTVGPGAVKGYVTTHTFWTVDSETTAAESLTWRESGWWVRSCLNKNIIEPVCGNLWKPQGRPCSLLGGESKIGRRYNTIIALKVVVDFSLLHFLLQENLLEIQHCKKKW